MTEENADSAGLSETFQRAVSLHQTGLLDQAKAVYEDILTSAPDHADALHLLGVISSQQKDHTVALRFIDRALELDPFNAAALNNRGIALQQMGQYDEALESYDRALAIKSDYAEAHYNRGITLFGFTRLQDALDSYDRAIRIEPNYAKAHNNRGLVLHQFHLLQEAIDSYDRAIAVKPDFAEAYNNRGNILLKLGRRDEAEGSYERATQIDPNYVDPRWGLTLLALQRGDFDRGWSGYELRWENDILGHKKRDFVQPLWLGKESIKGERILLHSEQGLGDTLQFCRYAKLVSELGATVVLEVPSPLFALLKTLDGVSELVAEGEALPQFDRHCPLLSLPLAFKTDLASIPAANRYVTADPAKMAQWSAKLGERTKPRVGLVWSCSDIHETLYDRSVALSDVVNHLPDRFQYVSLQKEVRGTDRETLAFRPDILHFGEQLEDFADTAALCEMMDLVISVDASVAHLAGALGKDLWVLLNYVSDWRWLLDRADSPWYPSARLFRQPRTGDWNGVMDTVRRELEKFRNLSI